MKNLIKLCIGILLMGFLQSCYYDNEEILYPDVAECDTTNVTYTGTVAPILDSYNCISCHGSSFPQGNVVLGNYDDLKIVVDNGRFWGAINHDDGYSPMPQNLPKMDDCDLKKIRTWMDEGAMNN
jgi:hypothetical protein